jgi:choline dehydrogenase-like flavoprotein
VRHIVVDSNTGKAKGVAFVDRLTFEEQEVRPKSLSLPHRLESTRILLNSKSRQHPNGLGNSSGVLGHYLVDHFGGIGASGQFQVLASRDPVNEDGKASGSSYRGFATSITRASRAPSFVVMASSVALARECFRDGPRAAGLWLRFQTSGQKVLHYSGGHDHARKLCSRVSRISPRSIPTASLMRGACLCSGFIQHSDNERAMARDAAECSEEILRAAGAEVVSTGGRMTAPGRIIHELGTARMGNDPKTSVLNKFNQMHDVKNVFVTDGAAFVGAANQNPTLTILALTMRACDYLADELKRGNV